MEYCRIKILYYSIKKGRSSFQGILFICILFGFFACSSLKKIGIEVAIQPEYPINEDVQSMALLNRSMNIQFENFKSDSLEKIIKNKMAIDTVFQDSIAADTAIQVAARALFESGRFDVIVPKEMNIFRTDTDIIVNPIAVSFINGICKDFNVDAVLILESFAERLDTKFYLNTLFVPNEFSAATDITYFTEWRLYRPENSKKVIRFQVGDSIFWTATGISADEVYFKMPRIKEALVGGGIASGLKMAGYISPNWVKQSRYYFETGKREVDAGIPLIKDNRWEDAAAIWNKYATAYSGTIKSKIEFNLALAAEMNGDLYLAIEWALKSFKTKYTKAAEVYINALEKIRIAKQKSDKTRY